jgi:phosphatidylglycerophosphatase A
MKTVKQKTIIFFATGGLIGFSPVAPGTFGSLAALPLCGAISLMGVKTALVFVSALVLICTWVAHAAESIEAHKDPKQVVVDEICGMAVTLFALPFTLFSSSGALHCFACLIYSNPSRSDGLK